MVQNNLYLDQIFIQRLSPKLERFQKKNGVWNFRCPICGDSKTSKRKARGYAYPEKQTLMVKCHNCSYIKPFHSFLKEVDGNLYKDYIYERYKHKTHKKSPVINPITKKPVFRKEINLDDIAQRIDLLPPLHFARTYLENRKLPRLDLFYYHSNFHELVSNISPKEETLDSLPRDKRIIIPFYDENKKLFAIQGRALESELRYITIKLDKDALKIYGLDRLDKEKTIHITEGPIDSLFLPNCIAAAGSDLPKNIDGIYIFDNQPRNKEIVEKIEKMINAKKQVFIWPSKIKEKDINEFVINNNYSQDDLLSLIEKNTFQGLLAKKAFGNWRKI